MEKESDILNSICEYLSYKKDLMFWRQNTSSIFNAKYGTYRAMPKYSMNGIPDIIVIKDGFFVGLEVKRNKGKQSEAQKEFEKICKENGGEYWIVRNIDDVKEIGI